MQNQEVDLLGLDERLREVEEPVYTKIDGIVMEPYCFEVTGNRTWTGQSGHILAHDEEEGWRYIQPPQQQEEEEREGFPPVWDIWPDECDDDQELPF